MLRPQDLLLALRIAAHGPDTLETLGVALGLSTSEVGNAVQRLTAARLLQARPRTVIRPALKDFAIYGAPYVFPAERGKRARGMPTATSAPPLSELFTSSPEVLVWPTATGSVRGESLTPLYKTAPSAAEEDPKLYRLLVLFDAIRSGTARVREVASKLLAQELAK